jgi:hypothetical protein
MRRATMMMPLGTEEGAAGSVASLGLQVWRRPGRLTHSGIDQPDFFAAAFDAAELWPQGRIWPEPVAKLFEVEL